jgi:hypothetical protein
MRCRQTLVSHFAIIMLISSRFRGHLLNIPQNWLTRCLEEIHRGPWAVPAITLFRDISALYPDEVKRAQVRTRADLWHDLGARHDLKKLALDSFQQYMLKAKEVSIDRILLQPGYLLLPVLCLLKKLSAPSFSQYFSKKGVTDPGSAIVVGRYNHISNVETRLAFIKVATKL